MPKQKTQDVAGGSREPWLLRVEDVAELLGVSRSSVYNLMNTNQLPSIRIAGCRRIPMEQLREWVVQQGESV
jgi:excisionase family DNA binding protein